MTRPPQPSSPRRSDRRPPRARAAAAAGYTLTEILIVIGLIVVMIAVAVPVLNVLSGNRSTEAAENQVAAVLNQARAQAIALQKNVGVIFYTDPASERPTMALVQDNGAGYIDLLPDYAYVPLQTGTGIQLVNDDLATIGKAPSQRDRYVRMGIVMFDGRGQAISTPYTIGVTTSLAEVIDLKTILNDMGAGNAAGYPPAGAASTQLGLVIYDNQAFATQNFSRLEGMKQNDEAAECDWLDANAVPFVLNRYNGTLIRGE